MLLEITSVNTSKPRLNGHSIWLQYSHMCSSVSTMSLEPYALCVLTGLATIQRLSVYLRLQLLLSWSNSLTQLSCSSWSMLIYLNSQLPLDWQLAPFLISILSGSALLVISSSLLWSSTSTTLSLKFLATGLSVVSLDVSIVAAAGLLQLPRALLSKDTLTLSKAPST